MIPSRTFRYKPDFDECLARIYAWYEQAIIDRPPVRFHHHNIEYERHRTLPGLWKTAEERWLDVDFQVESFVANEYEREPVPEHRTKGLRSFLGLFASEHVAATELLIGPLLLPLA